MRWFEITALILLGALIGGAYFFGSEAGSRLLFTPSVDRAYHDTYFVVAHQHYMRQLVLVLLAAAAVFGVILWIGRLGLRAVAAGALLGFSLSTALAVIPQHIVGTMGMPRRYIDPTDAFFTWNYISTITSGVATLCAALLVVLWVIALFQRLRHGYA